MTPTTPPAHPVLLDLSIRSYTRGRQDFVKTVAAALREPAFASVQMTGPQFATMLEEASEKCDAVKSANEKQN